MRWAALWTAEFPAGGDGEVGPTVRPSVRVSELHYAGVDLCIMCCRCGKGGEEESEGVREGREGISQVSSQVESRADADI